MRAAGTTAPSRVWFEGEARSLAHDGAEAWEIEMGARDGELVGGHAVEHAPARGAGGLRIDVVDEPGIGPRDLDRREMNEVAPDQQAALAGLDEPAGMPRGMAGKQQRGNARHGLAVPRGAHALAIRRCRHLRLGDVAADALGRAARLVAVRPDRRLGLL